MKPLAEMDPDVRDALAMVARKHRLTPEQILGHNRIPRIMRARGELYVVCAHTLGLSWSEIGRQLGRDHSTVLAWVRCFEEKLQEKYDAKLG